MISSILGSQIGFNNFRIGAHRLRPPGAIGLTLIENMDLVAYAHHQIHIVFDQQDGNDRAPAGLRSDLAAKPLAMGHAGGRLIEQQKPRLGRERTSDLHTPAVAIGQVARRRVGERAGADLLQQLRARARRSSSIRPNRGKRSKMSNAPAKGERRASITF